MLMETQIAELPWLPEPCDHFRRLACRFREDGGENLALAGRIAACRLDLKQLQVLGCALAPGNRLLPASPTNA